jgi:predicted nucleic acid-binding protein
MILTNDNEYAVVLDACVLAPMPLADTLLRLAEEPSLYRIVWTEELLQEIGGTLTKLGRTTAQVERRLKFMRDYFPEAMYTLTPEIVNAIPCLPDINDRHVVAAAILGHANAIVSANTKDFPIECLSRYDLVCQTPDEFLVHQYHLNPGVVLEKLDAQATGIREQRQGILNRLKVPAPTFVNMVEKSTLSSSSTQS